MKQMAEKYLPFVDEFVKNIPSIEKIRFGSIVVFKNDQGKVDVQSNIFTFPKERISDVITIINKC